MKKELLKKLQELKKSHLNFTEEIEMEFVMQNRDIEAGNVSSTTDSAVHSKDNRSSKFDGKPALRDLTEAPRDTKITSREVPIHLFRDERYREQLNPLRPSAPISSSAVQPNATGLSKLSDHDERQNQIRKHQTS